MATFERDVCVMGGCGHVGLPLAVLLADKGLKTAIYDIDLEAIAKVHNGQPPFMEDGLEPVLRRTLAARTLSVHEAPPVIAECRYLVVVIGTPVDEYLNPRVNAVWGALQRIRPHLRDGQTIVLRSTLYPGISAQLNQYVRDEGLKIDVTFCPERVAQGQSLREIRELPQIVSGFSTQGVAAARELFTGVASEIIELSPIEAELAKLFNNAWRYAGFAMANQFFMICNEHEVDFYRVHKAMTQNYPRATGLPRPGFAAGPCLLKDTMQLAAFYGHNFFLGHAAMLVNEGLPDYVARRLRDKYDLRNMSVGILGMAFKADSDDVRDSLSFRLRKQLQVQAREVLCSDPYAQFEGNLPLTDVLHRADILVIGVPHTQYRQLTWPDRKPVIDIWNTRGDGAVI